MLWLWFGFFALVWALLRLQRKTFSAKARTAAYWTGAWFVIGLLFMFLVYPTYEHAWLGAKLDEPTEHPGADASMKFLASYLLEYVLAFDSMLVLFLLFEHHRISDQHRTRLLFWGLALATGIRFIVLLGATSLAHAFASSFYVFGALSLLSAVIAGSAREKTETREDKLARFLRARGRLVRGEFGGRFFVVRHGRFALSIVGLCLVDAVRVEIFFALDAIYVLSVSTTTFVLVTSNVLAAIALRGWFPLLGTMRPIRFPTKTIATMLVLAGITNLMHDHVSVPPAIVLAAIVILSLAAVVECVVATRRARVP